MRPTSHNLINITEGHSLFKDDEQGDRLKQHLLENGLVVDLPKIETSDLEVREHMLGLVKDDDLRLSQHALAVAGLWANNHGREVHFSDIPSALHKYNIASGMHLLEIESLFEEVSRTSHKHDSMTEAALEVCPDFILHHSDEYLACLINHLSQSHQNIFVVCGRGQSKSIPYHLYYNPRAFQSIEQIEPEVTDFSDVFGTILRKDTPEIMMDKLSMVNLIMGSKSEAEELVDVVVS